MHMHVCSLAEKCHKAATEEDSDTVAELEAEIDLAAAKVWGITDDELRAIQDALAEMT